jgi:hypothetical protein
VMQNVRTIYYQNCLVLLFAGQQTHLYIIKNSLIIQGAPAI